MKEIKLDNGMLTTVDDKNYDFICKYGKWYFDGKYAATGTPITRMHELVIDCPSGFDRDHVNGNGLDNREENLRVCTRSQNTQRGKMRRNNTSGFRGVRYSGYNTTDKQWYMNIKVNGKTISSCHKTAVAAAIAYNEAALKHFGPLAKLNKIPNQ